MGSIELEEAVQDTRIFADRDGTLHSNSPIQAVSPKSTRHHVNLLRRAFRKNQARTPKGGEAPGRFFCSEEGQAQWKDETYLHERRQSKIRARLSQNQCTNQYSN